MKFEPARTVLLTAAALISVVILSEAKDPRILSVQARESGPAQTPKAAHLAPDFTRPTLDGKTIRLSDYRGKLVLLNFWATWCGPCIAEIPRFSTWQTKFAPQGFQVIGVSMDDDPAPVQKFNRKYQITYPIVMGDEHLGELYGGVLGLPISYLISPEGKIIARFQGETDLNQLEARISNLLQSKK